MKQLFFRLFHFSPLLLCIVSINYFVDPANIFKTEIYETMVNHLKNGDNITNVTNIDERLLQKLFIAELKECPDEIILGASRIMSIGKASNINKINCINNGVSGASLEDIFAIYYLYIQKGWKIKKISLGLEPYYLNDNHNQKRWKILGPEFVTFYNQLANQKKQNNNTSFDKYRELFSWSYFKSSLEYLKSENKKKIYPTKEVINEKMTRLTDGTITYDIETRNISQEKVEKSVKQAITNQPIYSMKDFEVLSEYYTSLFSSFVDYTIENDIELEFLLIPLHPSLFNYLQKTPNYKMFFEAEKFYREVATSKNIKIIGSYNPDDYQLDGSDFYDGFHCKEKAIEALYTQ